jgi:restriction system protein
MEEGYQSILKNIEAELLNNLKNSSPAFFEQAVVDLLIAMGYGGSRKDAGQAIGKSGDEGIDGFIKEDKLGLDMIYIQAKRWENPVGRPEVQSFVGALNGKFSKKGIFITTSRFTKEALAYADKLECKVILIDGWQLVKLMSEYNIGVSTAATYEIKKIDSDYFTEE